MFPPTHRVYYVRLATPTFCGKLNEVDKEYIQKERLYLEALAHHRTSMGGASAAAGG